MKIIKLRKLQLNNKYAQTKFNAEEYSFKALEISLGITRPSIVQRSLTVCTTLRLFLEATKNRFKKKINDFVYLISITIFKSAYPKLFKCF